jgi:hypothetical protein
VYTDHAVGDPHLTAEGVARVGLIVIAIFGLAVVIGIAATVAVVVLLMRGKR